MLCLSFVQLEAKLRHCFASGVGVAGLVTAAWCGLNNDLVCRCCPLFVTGIFHAWLHAHNSAEYDGWGWFIRKKWK